MGKQRKLTKAERVELDTFLQRMHTNALRTRELAERARASSTPSALAAEERTLAWARVRDDP